MEEGDADVCAKAVSGVGACGTGQAVVYMAWNVGGYSGIT